MDIIKHDDYANPYDIDNECIACDDEIGNKLNEEISKPFPNLFQLTRNLASDLKKNAKNVLAGNNLLVDRSIAKDRIEICRKCPEFSDSRCKHCGCFIEVKAHLAASSCPQYKW